MITIGVSFTPPVLEHSNSFYPRLSFVLDLFPGSPTQGCHQESSVDLLVCFILNWSDFVRKKSLSVQKQILIPLEMRRPSDALYGSVCRRRGGHWQGLGNGRAIGMMWIQKQTSTQQVQAEAFVQDYFWDERIQLRKINNTVNIFSFFLFIFFLMLKIYHVYFQKSWVKNNHFGL